MAQPSLERVDIKDAGLTLDSRYFGLMVGRPKVHFSNFRLGSSMAEQTSLKRVGCGFESHPLHHLTFADKSCSC